MPFNKYSDGKQTIYATERAFNLLYKDRGFFLCVDEVKSGKRTNAKRNTTKTGTARNSKTSTKQNRTAVG